MLCTDADLIGADMIVRASLRVTVRLCLVLGMIVSVGLWAAPVSGASQGGDPGCGGLAQCIANQANYEFSNDDGHKYEKPLGTNCNFFSTQWHDSSASKCSNGWWSEEWCMDFARWVYHSEAASVANLNHLAYSAKDYSTYKTYASGRRPRIGDLAVWSTESHVGIVVDVKSNGDAVVVSGNSWNPAREDYTAIWKSTYPADTFQGFAAPVAA
jgi:hypothetical protein